MCIRLENTNEISKNSCLRTGISERKFWPSRPPRQGWFFDTDMIRICTISVVDLNEKHQMDRNSKIAKNVPKMFQDSRCLTETPRFLDEIPRFPIDRNSKISEIPKPKVHSENRSIFPLVAYSVLCGRSRPWNPNQNILQCVCVCVYYCSTYYKAVRVGGGG
jgi:hypothetical protein